jgi:hypothetical protein
VSQEQPINTSSYVHPRDPHLHRIENAMEYDPDGKPHLRVTLGSDNITITGDVNLVDTVTVNSTPEDPVHIHITEVGTSGILNVPYMPIQGTVSIGTDGTVSLSANTLSALENITVGGTVELGATTLSALENITVSGTVELGATTLSALENIGVTGTFWQATQPVSIATMPTTPVTGTFWQATQPVSGTVTIQDGGNTITVDGTVTANVTFPTTQQVSGTVALDTNTLTALENISATVSGTVELGSTTLTALENVGVTGTVELGSTTLTALENTTVTISGTPTVNIGTMPEVEIKNDSGNPVPISATTAANTALNPIYVEGSVTIDQTSGDPTLVKYVNSSNLQMDMVDRLRVASTSQMWWYAPTIDKDGDLRYIESITGTNAATNFVQNLSSINLTSGTDASGSVIRISRRRHKLRPGISMLASFSLNWNGYVPDGNVTKRAGMFTNFNGIFYEMSNDLQVVIRRRLTDGTLVERRVPRTSFTEDRLDGTGATGYDLRPVVKNTANITAYVSKSSVVVGGNGGTVYRVVFTVSDPTQFFVSQKGRITGVTPTLFNSTVMVTAISGNNVTFVYNQDPGTFSSLSSAKFEHTNLHHQYVFGFDFTGTRVGKCRFFMDSPLGRIAIHIEDFTDELSTPFVNAPAMSLRYEIFNSGAPGRLPNLTVSSEMINIEAEAVLNPGFGTAQRSTALAINKGTRTEYALLGVGLRPGEPNQRADLQVQNIELIDSGNVNTQNAGVYQWRLVLNPSFEGTAVPTPSDIGKCTRMWNYNNGTTISGGVTLIGGYVTSTTTLDVTTALNFLNLGSNIAYDDADKLVLAVKMVVDGTSDAALLATMNFIEAL